MSTRQYGKSILQGMDFGKLEQRAMSMLEKGELIHDSIMVSSPTMRMKDDVLDSMLKAMNSTITGRCATALWPDDIYGYIPPEPHCKQKVFDIIDKFWNNPGEGHMYLYLEQLKKNPITRDLFKSKSTTHHFPWYRRGSKY